MVRVTDEPQLLTNQMCRRDCAIFNMTDNDSDLCLAPRGHWSRR